MQDKDGLEDLEDSYTLFNNRSVNPLAVSKGQTLEELRERLGYGDDNMVYWSVDGCNEGRPLNHQDEWLSYNAAVEELGSSKDMYVWADNGWESPR